MLSLQFVSWYSISLIVSLPIVVAIWLWARRDRRLDKLSGPKGNIFVGIGLSLPSHATQRLREWAGQYGEVYKVRIGWYNWVVISSPEAIKEIFDKQSISTSSKMPAPMGELVVGGMRMLTMPYGPKWRAYRTMCHQLLTPKKVLTFVPTKTFEVKQLMYELAFQNDQEVEFYGHIRRMLFSVMMTAVFGRRVDRADHEDIKYSEQSGRLLGKLGKAGTFIEDEIPPLAKLPEWLQPSRKQALEHSKWVHWVKMRLWDSLQAQHDAGVAPECYAKQMMSSNYKSQGLEKEDCAWIAGGLVEAGSQTSAATLTNLVLYLAAFPEAQAKAAQEVSSVVGDSRAPEFDDLERMPYVRACIKEILRLCPAPPWILRHFTDSDVVYKDLVIPKGTAIVGNTSAIHFDENRYPDPFEFKPERYIHHTKYAAEYAAMADPYERDHFTFGAGRRVCPGSRFAENMLSLALANMLWGFEMRPGKVIIDGQKRDAPLNLSDDNFDDAPLRSTKPFKARFLPRNEQRLEVIRSNWNTAEATI